MPTTFSSTFKNATISSILGKASNNYVLAYVNPYSGAQAADPLTAPAGTFVYSSYSQSPQISGYLTAPSVGISTLTGARVGSVGATNTVTSAFARIFDASATGVIDTAITNSGGGGGVIAATLTSSVGIPFQIDAFTFKVPLNNGTILYNTSLANAINSIWTQTANNIAAFSSAAINVYSGTAPATADAPATGTLLCVFTTAAAGASWGAVAAGSAALAASITSANALATGTAGYIRVVKNTYTLQGSVGTTAADFIINTTSIVSGNTYTLTDATITL